MITLHYYNDSFTADKAVRTDDSITLYDGINTEVHRIINIHGTEWDHISLDGEWSDPSDIPTETEKMQADIDYLFMLIDEE